MKVKAGQGKQEKKEAQPAARTSFHARGTSSLATGGPLPKSHAHQNAPSHLVFIAKTCN